MAHTDAEALNAQDERFAARLKAKDKTVVADIDDAYTPALYKLLQPLEGPMLRSEDMAEIAQDALLAVWNHFSTKGGSKKLRNFFFDQAKWKATDLLREREREIQRRKKILMVAGTASPEADTPPKALEHDEESRAEEAILAAVEELKQELTERQRTAFEGRFGDESSRSWASQLEDQTGKAASYWRKASDDALQAVKRGLEDRGLLRKKGGRYEVA